MVTIFTAQLRPNPGGYTASQLITKRPNALPIDQFVQKSVVSAPDVQQETVFRPLRTTKLDPVAQKLNDLLNDYFTTSFGQVTQDKWAYELSIGSPFLSELAAYLKIDKLYGINLHLERSQSLNKSIRLDPSSNDNGQSESQTNLFDYMKAHSDNFWPMSVIAPKTADSASLKILLNHYDRDFIFKIETQDLSTTYAPLSLGIERLLRFHLSEIVKRNSGLRSRRFISDIDQTVEAFKRFKSEQHLFEFYNLMIQRNWLAAAEYLKTTPKLNTPEYVFLYDLIAIHSADALLATVDYRLYSSHKDWWDRFLFYQLCILSDANALEQLNQRASIQINCATDQIKTLPLIASTNVSNTQFKYFWDEILNHSRLSISEFETISQTLNASELTQLNQINTHIMLDYLAREGRLKIIRNPGIFQRIEANYQKWHQFQSRIVADSFYQYTSLHAWFNQRRSTLRLAMRDSLPYLIPQLSPSILQVLSEDSIRLLEKAFIQPENIATLQPILSRLNDKQRSLFDQFAALRPDYRLTPPDSSQAQISDQGPTEESLKLLLSWQTHHFLDISPTFDDYALRVTEAMLDLQSQYADSPFAAALADRFDDNGRLTSYATRALRKTWNTAGRS